MDTNKLKELAERAQISRVGEWYNEGDCCWWTGRPDEGDFMAAATPQAILGLIAEVERLTEEISACTEHPGGCGYWREAAKLREAERDKIQAEVERFKDANREISETNTRRRDENVRLKAENAALRKDAERYRWLRVQPNDCTAPRIDVVRWEPMDESANEGEGLRFEALDAAIDAALEGGGK